MQTNFKDEWLNKAFQLAFFIHGDRETAKKIAVNAMNKLETASNAQFKRYYYTPTGRSENSRAARSRVSLNDLQLLQRLVLVESENFEKEEENESDEKTLLKFFIKHLVRISLKRNSFYVTLGISRILHNYGTNDAMEIYNIVVQDPERVHDDYYYRSRKGVLMKELKKRFGELLSTVKVNRGEERFEQKEADEEILEAAKEALKTFTPWNSFCAIPEEFDPFDDTIKPFHFDKEDPDEEHRIEINRIHAALHPECFQRLTDALNLPSSEQKMEIPKFMISNNRQNIDNNWKSPPNLKADELQGMKDFLTAQAENRKAVSANFLRIFVDGDEQAAIDLSITDKINLDLDETAELIEIRVPNDDGGFVLATHLLSFDELDKGNLEEKVLLENGKEISFNFVPTKDKYGEITAINCGIGFIENEKEMPLAIVTESKSFSFFGWFQNLTWGFKPALAFGLILLIFGFGWLVFRQFDKDQEMAKDKDLPSKNEKQQIVVPETPKEILPEQKEKPEENPEKPKDKNETKESENKGKDSLDKKPNLKKEKSVTPKSEIRIVNQPKELQANDNRRNEIKGTDKDGILKLPIRETTQKIPDSGNSRNGNFRRSSNNQGKSLKEIKQIFIEISGDEVLGKQIAEQLAAEIQSLGRFSISNDKENADAALKIYVRHESDVDDPNEKIVTVIVRLVNAEGFVVYPNRKGISGWKYVGEIAKLPKRIADDLKVKR